MKFLPGDLVRTINGFKTPQRLFKLPTIDNETNFGDRGGILYANDVCLVIAVYLMQVFVLTQRDQMGWKHNTYFEDRCFRVT